VAEKDQLKCRKIPAPKRLHETEDLAAQRAHGAGLISLFSLICAFFFGPRKPVTTAPNQSAIRNKPTAFYRITLALQTNDIAMTGR
jgi:hypothetical protein